MRPGPFGKLDLAAGHGGQDGHRVAVLDRSLQPVQEPDVLVVQVDVDEPAQALVVDQPLAQAAVLAFQVSQQLVEGGSVSLDLLGPVGVGAQDGRDANLDGHERRSLSPVMCLRWQPGLVRDHSTTRTGSSATWPSWIRNERNCVSWSSRVETST